ncbi:MAG TPA: energy transducer TonB, partial [Blastocatellia bacterium]|nr:energy transducer TonB [Blastocatellia bacterium]
VPGGVEGGVPGGVEGGVPGGVLSLEPELVQDANLRERLKEAPPIYMRIDISNDAPLLITDASFKVVRLEQTSDRYAVRPQMNLTNKTDRKMSGFVLEIADSTGESGFHLGMFNPPLDPYDTYHAWENNLTFLSLSGSPESWVARVVGVMFKDGGKWGEVPPPPPPPPPPQLRPSNKTIELLEMSPDTQIEFINVEGSPVSITQASVKATAFEGATSSGDKNFTYWIKPSITMVNNTSRVIKALMISISSTASRSIGYKMMDAAIVAPHATFVYRDPTRYRLSYLAIPGSLDSLRIRLLGVVFENGETWGSVPPTPLPRILESMPGPPEGVGPAGEPPSGVGPAGEGRVQKARLINRVYPNYTEQARVNKVSGLVKMEVLVGADGKVKDARIIEGLHDGLNEEALRAAYKMRFRPTMRDSVPEESCLTIRVEFSLR